MIGTNVMPILKLADYLKVKDCIKYRLVTNGEMPGFKVGGSWRFVRAEIDRWIETNAVGPREEYKWVGSRR